jgi:hypothetical protein
MHHFIVQHPRAFLLAALGVVIAVTGLGSVALAVGVPIGALLIGEAVVLVAAVISVLLGVPEREGGVAALFLGGTFPQMMFFAWLQSALVGHLAAALAFAVLGLGIAVCAVYGIAPRDVAVHGKLTNEPPPALRATGNSREEYSPSHSRAA